MFVWGNDVPGCSEAVWGRGGDVSTDSVDVCRSPSNAMGAIGSPEAPRAGSRDAIVLDGGTIFDLAGNVREWARDKYDEQSGPCWSPIGVRTDPVCTSSASGLAVSRGGSWDDDAWGLEAARRSSSDPTIVYVDTGFRCARPAR
jgi:formylglycine-generating enzyme required for sulfatase activity